MSEDKIIISQSTVTMIFIILWLVSTFNFIVQCFIIDHGGDITSFSYVSFIAEVLTGILLVGNLLLNTYRIITNK